MTGYEDMVSDLRAAVKDLLKHLYRPDTTHSTVRLPALRLLISPPKTSLWILAAKGLRQHALPMLNLSTGLGHTPTGGSQ